MLAGALGCSWARPAAALELAVPAFTLAAMGIFAVLPMFWTLPTAMLTGTAAASDIALINAIGTLSGYLGPVLMGRLKDDTVIMPPVWRSSVGGITGRTVGSGPSPDPCGARAQLIQDVAQSGFCDAVRIENNNNSYYPPRSLAQ